MNAADRRLAAEWAVGLAEGRDETRAAQLNASDPEFAAEARRWAAWLATLLVETGEIPAPQSLWPKIAARLGSLPANDNAARVDRQLRMWRGVTAMMTALAACFALLLFFRPVQIVTGPAPAPRPAPIQASGKPMVAMVGEDQDDMMIVANWDPAQRRLVLAVSGDMPADPGKSHEIWVVPQGGSPKSLGTMPEGKKMHMDLAETIAELLRQGTTIAISLEPPGGSPTGAPTGPVKWSGKLESA